MTPSGPMAGRRRSDDTEPRDLLPGDYLLRPNRMAMWLCLPNAELARLPVNEGSAPSTDVWGFTEHDDETITVSPSIWLKGEREWHGFLTKGTWTEV
jgi:hypothetical protein